MQQPDSIIKINNNNMPQRGVKGRVFEKMKKFLSSALVLLLVLVGLFAMTGCDSKPVLRLYNWYDYMDESILKEFEKEYGCTVRVSYFTDNEGMLTKLQAPGANYDLLFPSDYTVQRLIALDMLAELDHGNIPNIENIDKKYLDMSYDMGGRYSVPYMWGTVGILYNKNKVSDEVNSWDILWNEKYADEIYMLDSSRDSIGLALMRRGYSLNDRSDEALAAAKEELMKQKPLVKSYYV
ncbi:MAG: spermidine/putrescine ABC transporter substrate-binding protein, partial [Candidatus Ventricola sp.]|nr:spermidine/putrescine ABC transporter substrate-binding protein [Candidatus Ventricola sp.]